jgi:hypothetical protein
MLIARTAHASQRAWGRDVSRMADFFDVEELGHIAPQRTGSIFNMGYVRTLHAQELLETGCVGSEAAARRS